RRDPGLIVGLWEQKLPPKQGGPSRIGRAVEQAVDERRSLPWVRVIQEVACLACGRDLPDQVEACAPEEVSVVGRRRRADFRLGPTGGQSGVDPRSEGFGLLVAALLSGRQRPAIEGGNGAEDEENEDQVTVDLHDGTLRIPTEIPLDPDLP